MLRPHYFILLASLLVDGGTATPQPGPPGPDAGVVDVPANPPKRDAGTVGRKPVMVDGIRWPEDDELRLLTRLDGRAVMAAHAAIQQVMAGFAKEDKRYVGSCEASPKAMDVSVFEGPDMYVVGIRRRLDRCGGFDPSFNDVFPPDVYAVSLDGRILAHYPYNY